MPAEARRPSSPDLVALRHFVSASRFAGVCLYIRTRRVDPLQSVLEKSAGPKSWRSADLCRESSVHGAKEIAQIDRDKGREAIGECIGQNELTAMQHRPTAIGNIGDIAFALFHVGPQQW